MQPEASNKIQDIYTERNKGGPESNDKSDVEDHSFNQILVPDGKMEFI